MKPIAEAAAPMTMADLLVSCYGEEGGRPGTSV